ncbi:hypothetical protein LCGC14_1678440 [marine sediment metagenome]|uniref:Uncharacterized protein n=1 Tax=marine sediment metagenome TaxID=412755 RepID=A0A0F9HPE7_9ZZZZ
MKYLVLILLVLAGCYDFLPTESTTTASSPVTFEEVSQPYIELYGQPEDIYKYDSADYHTVDWWWWTKGIMVGFANTPYDGVDGWAVDNTYTFPPIGYLTH